MRLDQIAAYMYAADIYCPGCTNQWALSNLLSRFEWRDVASMVETTTESLLDALADETGFDRTEEHSFDSDDFPKIVLNQMMDPSDVWVCGECFTDLLDADR